MNRMRNCTLISSPRTKIQKCKLSVVVPIYNAEKFLSTCLDSIISQDLDGFEVVLVDDGSTDSSEKICCDYAKKYSFVTTLHQANGGVSAARNLGVQHVLSEYVVFVDADDFLPIGALSTMYAVAESYPADMHIFNLARTSGSSLNVRVPESHLPLGVSYMEVQNVMHLLLRYQIPVGPVAKLFRSSLFQHIDFAMGMKVGEDLLFNLCYLNAVNSRVVLSDTVVYYCVVNPQSAMHTCDPQKDYDRLNASVEEWLHKSMLHEIFHDDFLYFKTINILQIISRGKAMPSEGNGYLPFLRSLPLPVIHSFAPRYQKRLNRLRKAGIYLKVLKLNFLLSEGKRYLKGCLREYI